VNQAGARGAAALAADHFETKRYDGVAAELRLATTYDGLLNDRRYGGHDHMFASEAVMPRDVLSILRGGTPRTKSELAALTGQARSTVSLHIDALAERGLVSPLNEATATRGRPSALYAFRPGAGMVLAADLGAHHAHLAVTDLSGSVLSHEQITMAISEGPDAVLKRVIISWQAQFAKLDVNPQGIVGAGVGLPGPVEHETGRPVSPPIMPEWDGFDVVGMLRGAFDVPVLVDNDVNLLALGEWIRYCPGETDLIVVKVATGIGAGIVSGGQLIRGSQGAAGDIGHIIAHPGSDRLCRCGQVGCLEAVASGSAIAQTLRLEGIAAEDTDDVVALVRAGDPHALRAVREAGRTLGETLSACVAILNPNRIILGGEISSVGEPILAGIRETIYRRAQPLATRSLSISTMKDPVMGGVVGAVHMALEAVLK
jgi:predicted NBD/HSP70 family sugar kinase